MKLLLDENLSPGLVEQLASAYPGTQHVDRAGLHRARGERIREFARDEGFVLVSKDSDFRDLAVA